MRGFRRLAAAACALVLAAGGAVAQTGAPLTLVVPAGAGSAPDIAARLIADELRTRLSQPVLVDNRPGAGGIIAAMAVKTARPDGNTLLFTHASVVTVTPLTYRAAVYDAQRDFETVAVVSETPMLFVAHPTLGPKSLADLLARAKAAPGTVPLGSTARGSVPNLGAELLGLLGDARFNLVASPGSAQAVQTVLAGDTVASVDGIPPLLPLARSGRLTALAVTADRVLPGLEGLPLAKDTVPGLVLTGWFMMFAPKGTPAARVQAVNAAVDAALRSEAVVRRLHAAANFPVGGSVADARAYLARELKLWAEAVRRAGLKRE